MQHAFRYGQILNGPVFLYLFSHLTRTRAKKNGTRAKKMGFTTKMAREQRKWALQRRRWHASKENGLYNEEDGTRAKKMGFTTRKMATGVPSKLQVVT